MYRKILMGLMLACAAPLICAAKPGELPPRSASPQAAQPSPAAPSAPAPATGETLSPEQEAILQSLSEADRGWLRGLSLEQRQSVLDDMINNKKTFEAAMQDFLESIGQNATDEDRLP